MTYGAPSTPYASSNGLYKSPISSGTRPTSAHGSGSPNWTPNVSTSASGGFGRRPSINAPSAYTASKLPPASPSSMASFKSPGAGNYGYNTATTATQSAEAGYQKPSYLARPSSFASLPPSTSASTTNFNSGSTFTAQTPSYQPTYQSPYPSSPYAQKPPTPSFARPPSPGFGGYSGGGGGTGSGGGLGGKTLVGPYRPSSVARQW